ncbi:FAR1 DNA binding domain [Macleaya cordata]|uniref:FAR1 DNA binding domain n=1 Tax=Macleaya cordata TaxID=56857 RepID=A0A200QAG7_MACCD|nr:FAR1 DNA binding domain [Macleaya cordata]
MESVDAVESLNELQDSVVTSNPNCSEDSKKPAVGMVSSSMEEAHLFYENYGRDNGFCIRVRSKYTYERGSNSPTYALFTCSCEGVHKKRSVVSDEAKKRNVSTVQSDCKARLRVGRDKNTSGQSESLLKITTMHWSRPPSGFI